MQSTRHCVTIKTATSHVPLRYAAGFISNFIYSKYNLKSTFCPLLISVTGNRQIECSNYSGGDRRLVHNTTVPIKGLAIQDGVAYYTTDG